VKLIKSLTIGMLILVLCLVSTSCTVNTPLSTVIPVSTPTPISGIEPPPIERNWISPAVVQVANFYPGATAEWAIQVHNGYSSAVDKYLVTTDPNEYSAWIHLKKILKEGNVANVIDILSTDKKDVATGEVLTAISYNASTNEIKIEGFKPDFARYLTIEYDHQSSTTYSVYYRNPDTLKAGYSAPPAGAQSWIIIADPSPVLAPYETREVMVTLMMPSKAVAPDKWSFWVGVTEKSNAGAGVAISIELCSTWLICMKGAN